MAFNFKNGIMDSFKMSDEDEYEDEFDDSDFEEEEDVKPRRGLFGKKTVAEDKDDDMYDEPTPVAPVPTNTSSLRGSASTRGNVQSLNTTTDSARNASGRKRSSNVVNFRGSSSADAGEISMIKPKNPDQDGMYAIDELKAGKTVILNLDGMDSKQAQHILDYVSGASYCMGCNFGTIASNVYVFSPISVQLTGDFPSSDVKEASDSFSSYSKTYYSNKYEY